MHGHDVFHCRDPARADGPDRLIATATRPAATAAPSPSGTEPSICALTTASAFPESRSSSVSPTQMITLSTRSQRRFGLGAHQRVVLAVIAAPFAVASDHKIRADIGQHGSGTSPVCAPSAAVWRSCPPTPMPVTASRTVPINGAGGASAISTSGYAAPRRSMARAFASMARLPFIFQLPTM